MVEAQQTARALSTDDRAGPVEVGGQRDELTVQALMVSLLVVMEEVLSDRGARWPSPRSTSLLRHSLLMEQMKRSA
jgi:hypothetical protein